jgi:hypothetical protein
MYAMVCLKRKNPRHRAEIRKEAQYFGGGYLAVLGFWWSGRRDGFKKVGWSKMSLDYLHVHQ